MPETMVRTVIYQHTRVDRYLHIVVLMMMNMMAATRVETALTGRLERLNGEDLPCGIPGYKSLAQEILSSARFASTLKQVNALADENRLLCVALLKRRKELCACEIQAATGLTHATVSHHMGILVDAGIVNARRQGKWMHYSLVGKKEVNIP